MKSIEKSFSVFFWHIKIWEMIAIYPINYSNDLIKYLHRSGCVVLHILLAIVYPLTMIIGLFQQDNVKDILENLAMVLSMVMVSVKGFCIWLYMDNFLKMDKIVSKLEPKFTSTPYGVKQHEECKKQSNFYFKIFATYYLSVVLLAGLTILTFTEKRLQYPAYFPFDWKSNNSVYAMLAIYQYFGWLIVVGCNCTFDTYPPLLIFLLQKYLDILSNRISSIGYDEDADAHQLLKESIEDHKLLNEYFNLLDETISFGMFGMFIVVTINLVSTVLLTIYFCDHIAQKVYFLVLFGGYTMEIILACYYGTQYTATNDDLKTAIYKCNWIEQSKAFKMDMLIFVENSLRSKEFIAGGIVPISLISFMSIMKSSYSTFTVLNQMSKNNK